MYRPNLKSVILPVPEIIAIEVLGEGCKPNLGDEEAIGGRGFIGGWYRSVRKSVGEFL